MMDVDTIRALADAQAGYASAAYRWLHRHPELSFQEVETARYVADQLRSLDLEPRIGVGRPGEHGVVAVLGADRPGPAVALRADMDALPLEEATDLPWRSQRPGVMHACGHDAHTAILLATAAALRRVERDHPRSSGGPVVLLFQPAEEQEPGGALGMIEAGVLDSPPVEAIFGLHQSPLLDTGTIGLAVGARSAAADDFTLTIRGRGGHAAWPHRTVDPVVVAAHVVTALQTVVSRQTPPTKAAVVTVATIHGGTKDNIIPDEVVMTGTVRTLSPELRTAMPQRVEALVQGVAGGFGAEATLDYTWGYPVLVNDAAMTTLAERAATRTLGEEQVVTAEPVLGAEDFAYFLEQRPGCFASLGVGVPSTPLDERPTGHSARFRLDEAALPVGVAYYLAILDEWARSSPSDSRSIAAR